MDGSLSLISQLKGTSFEPFDEVFEYLCTYISRNILFHLKVLRTPRESWEKLDSLFNKQDDLWGHILENELVSLHPSSFETIEQFFTTFKSLVL